MTRAQLRAVEDAEGLRKFILEKFKEREESPRDFANNSDYKRQSVDMVVRGVTCVPRIRRDLAQYLDYRSWQHLVEAFEEEEGRK